ncbi:hypothetical protein [Candidatus Mesenet endosymbiont of Agriotes lineatus]|uniref:hypothetical protein n=1 Tax=Candidatus Mesenet endosymbiont of Agriotes lineatus TaxID=3077948 RepID=UPI0030D24C1A
MISGIVNKIKDGAKGLDSSISERPWKSLWSMPKAVYGAAKYLIYHPTRLIIKGFPYAVNLEQTWKQNIRPKIPFGNPDVYFDVKANKTTSKDYGIRFDPIMKKKDHGEDIRVKVPKYKLPQRSVQQFEAWLEGSEEDKGNKDFVPKSSDKKKLSNDEQEAYNQLIELYEFIKRENGTIRIEGEALVIRINTAGKTFEEIEEQVKNCYNVLGLPFDEKMIKTITKRLYKKAQDQAISSDQPFVKTKPQLKSVSTSTSPSHSVSSSQSTKECTDGEILEDATKQQSSTNTKQQPMLENSSSTLQSQNKNDTKNMESIKQIPNIEMKMQSSIHNSNLSQNEEKKVDKETGEIIKGESIVQKEEQMGNNMSNSQFSLTNPGEFPPNIVSLQSTKEPNELQNDLISRSEVEGSDISNMKNKIVEVAGEDFKDVSLNTTSTKSPCITRSRGREEISRGG